MRRSLLVNRIFRQVRIMVVRISRSARTISAPTASAWAMARSISSPGLMPNRSASFF